MWAFWDFLPTAAELAGAAAPAGIDGISVVPALDRQAAANHRTLYWEFHERGFHQAVRRDNWKLVRQGPAQARGAVRPRRGPRRNAQPGGGASPRWCGNWSRCSVHAHGIGPLPGAPRLREI